ncbi:glycosyltransferase family 4 protein [Vibrio sp. HN007]|uniref:glycosyltransferase family 4 protein n=1 Tax=Vibrio iocasae TaxID=3098914 RepID=UPI0035D50025
MSNINPGEIWLITDSRRFGGIESHIIELAKGLKAHKQPVRVILLKMYDDGLELKTKLENVNIACSFLDKLAPGKNPLLALISEANEHKPLILHAHGYKAGLICKLSGLIVNAPVAVTYHAGETPKGKVWLYDYLDRYTAFICSTRFSVSPAIDKKIPSQTTVLNNFVSMPKALKNRGKLIAYAGRLSHEKAPDRFINLAKSFPLSSFVLYGDGDMMEELNHNAPDNVSFAGYQEMSDVWSDIDILVIPSRFEGLPMVALEAMARTIPVIAMDVGALSNLIKHGENGWLCQREEQLVEALQTWVSMSDDERECIQVNCRETVKSRFSDTKIIPQILDHYRHAL